MTKLELAEKMEIGAAHKNFVEDTSFYLCKFFNKFCGCAIGAAVLGVFEGDGDKAIEEIAKTECKGTVWSDFATLLNIEAYTVRVISYMHVDGYSIAHIIDCLKEERI